MTRCPKRNNVLPAIRNSTNPILFTDRRFIVEVNLAGSRPTVRAKKGTEMQYQTNVKIVIDKRKLDTLIRLGVSDQNLLSILKTQRFEPTGDALIDEYLSTLVDVKEFSNWGGIRKNSGRKPKNNQLENQDDNQLENQDDNQLENQDDNQLENQDDCNLDDKDKDIYVTGNSVTGNSVTGNSVTDSKEKKKNIKKKKSNTDKGCRFENSPYFNETMPKDFENESSKMNPFQSAEREYQFFKDYWKGKAGAAATKKDWIATWRNWLRNSRTFKDVSHVLNREAVKNQMAYLEQMKAQGDEFFIQRAQTRLKQIIEQELEK